MLLKVLTVTFLLKKNIVSFISAYNFKGILGKLSFNKFFQNFVLGLTNARAVMRS